MTVAAPHPGEEAALDARRELGLAIDEPLRDLLEVVEDRLRLPVLFDRFAQPEVAGLLLKRADGDHFIAVNADQPAFGSPRQRFTLAHEVGHVYMAHQPRVDYAKDLFESDGRDEQEVAANYFAAEFIAPRPAVIAWLERHKFAGEPGNADTVAKFGLSFGLSFKATCYRLQRAGALSQAGAARLVIETARNARDLAVRHAAWRLMDQIEALWRGDGYPRQPRETVMLATAAHEAGLLDDDEFASIVPSQPEDGDPFSDWAA